ncbi:MAG: iron complex outermembrane receptor protein [Cryomorphaceae bacterium]|jgi:iron complex outermembrane receptor protein
MKLRTDKTKISSSLAFIVGASIAVSGVSHAQLEEIVVTANKRSESIQSVSASISAIGGEMLDRAGIEDITRLEHLVPGLRVGQSGNEGRLAMRGTRTNNVGPDAEQVVGIFQDGVYVATTTQALGAYVDLERIEVLRGPQGTLYGRNTFGGTINVISKEPDFDEFSGRVKATFGDFNKKKIEAALNMPLSDTFAVRVAAMKDEHDGYIENTFVDGPSDDLDSNDATYYRVTAKWQPTDSFSALVRYSDYSRDANTSAIWGYQQLGGFANNDGVYALGHPYLPDNSFLPTDQGPHTVSRNFPSDSRVDDSSTSLVLEYDMDFATAKLLYNETEFEGYHLSDFDYSNGGVTLETAGDYAFLGRNNSQESESIEAQIVSNGDTSLQWMVGLYKYEQTADWGWVSKLGGEIIPYGYGHNDFSTESEAIFANATYSVNDSFRVLAGIRDNKDTKGIGDQLNEWTDTLWKVGAEYDVSDDAMTYFTASTGFRAGGFNSSGVAAAILGSTGRNIESYDPEQVTAYEIGYKSTLQGGDLIVNVAAFYNDYTDMQAQSFFTIPGEATVSEYTENGGEVEAKGVEVEVKWVPADNWYVAGSVAYLDAEFGNYDIASLNGLGTLGGRQGGGVLSLEGWAPALSPDVTIGGQVSYDFSLGDKGMLTPMLQFTYTSDYYSSDINLAPTQQDAHTKSDFRLIWDHPEAGFQLEAFILNIEDEAVLNRTVPFNPSANSSVTSIQASFSRPRTWGVSARYEF